MKVTPRLAIPKRRCVSSTSSISECTPWMEASGTWPIGCMMDVGFAISCSLARHRRPQIQFLFISSRVCSALLSDLASRLKPLRFAITSPPSGCEEDFHLQAVKHARHTTKRRRLDACAAWEALGFEY